MCQPYRARTKGKVESGVKYVKRNALAGRRFRSWEDLEAWLAQWMAEVADVRTHGTTYARPIDRFAQEAMTPDRSSDRPHPQPLPAAAPVLPDRGRTLDAARAGGQARARLRGANLFFQLISRRYERGAIILTSNQSLGAWGEVFGDPVIATAVLDRLLHHSITVNIRDDSYRLREKLKAGLLKPKLVPNPATRTTTPEPRRREIQMIGEGPSFR